MMQTKRTHRLAAAVTGLVFTFSAFVLPHSALAIDRVDTEAKTSLTVNYTLNDTAVSGATVHLYRVASMDGSAEFTLAEDFADSQAEINRKEDTTSEQWDAAAKTLADYAAEKDVAETAQQTSDDTGTASFTELESGMYLVVTDKLTSGKKTYTFAPFLVSLPSRDDGSESWTYDVTANPKGEMTEITDKDVSYQVVKHWQNDGTGKTRPSSVKVTIFKDSESYQSVTLSSSNNWSYSWTAKEDGSTWTVKETTVTSGYTPTVSQNKTTFTITNTYKTPSAGTTTPNTGDDTSLLWPIVGLAGAGLLLILLGLRARRRTGGNE